MQPNPPELTHLGSLAGGCSAHHTAPHRTALQTLLPWSWEALLDGRCKLRCAALSSSDQKTKRTPPETARQDDARQGEARRGKARTGEQTGKGDRRPRHETRQTLLSGAAPGPGSEVMGMSMEDNGLA
ncbi:hypothetical protein LZ30DRAFT_766183 [Colletotrichum cereale]|nr:hypothetical protein LZ30DRAFT_766183 [Colletotrichum cereale]